VSKIIDHQNEVLNFA
jgi:hypothetical protein